MTAEENTRIQPGAMNWKVCLAVLTASAFIMEVSYTMIFPFLPIFLMEELGVGTEDLNYWNGLIFSVTFVISGVMAPIWGKIADKKSKKLMAVRASVCLTVAYLLFSIVQTPWQLFWVRAFQGFSAGLWPASIAIVSTVAPARHVGFCMGTMAAGLTAGAVAGPLVGGVLSEFFGMRTSFMMSSLGLLVISLMLIFIIHEPPKRVRSGSTFVKKGPGVLRRPVIQRMLFAAGAVQLSVMMAQPVLPLYIGELQGSGESLALMSGIVFATVGVAGIFASTPWGVAGQRLGYRPVLYSSMLLYGLFCVVQAIPEDLTWFTVWRFVAGLAYAGIYPAINAVFTESTDQGERGLIFGWSYSVQQVGAALGPFAGGAAAALWGNQGAIAASGVVLFPLVLVLYMMRPKAKTISQTNQ